MLELSVALKERVHAWCEAGYPHEACGLLLGAAEGDRRTVTSVHIARNLNTERAHDRYDLDPADFVAGDAAARDQGMDVVGIFHSHPDHPSAPSATDLAHAQPGWSYVIVEVAGGKVASLRSWLLRDPEGGRRFEQEPVEET